MDLYISHPSITVSVTSQLYSSSSELSVLFHLIRLVFLPLLLLILSSLKILSFCVA